LIFITYFPFLVKKVDMISGPGMIRLLLLVIGERDSTCADVGLLEIGFSFVLVAWIGDDGGKVVLMMEVEDMTTWSSSCLVKKVMLAAGALVEETALDGGSRLAEVLGKRDGE
jgi:hypothetical protein